MRRLFLSSSLALAASLGFFPLTHAQEPASPSPDRARTAPPASSESPSSSSASPATAEPEEDADAADDAADATDDAASDQPRVLEPPNLPPLQVGAGDGASLPDPDAAADRLAQAAPAPVEKRGWTLPETVFQLHGYMRLRGTYLKDGALGHHPAYDRLLRSVGQVNYDPFPFFTPDDSTTRTGTSSSEGTASEGPVVGGCGDEPINGNGNGSCSKRGQVSGDLRLRLKPEIHLSDDVRIKAWIDVLDNVGLGTMGYGPNYTPNEADASTAIRARRVWGEARNRDIGELRFGRMGADWGLGILDNGGDRLGIDSDFSSEVDRIMGITNLAGFYIMAAYDWASEGKVIGKRVSPSGLPIDAAQKDDTDAFTFSVAHKLDEAAQQGALARGEAVFNYGLYFIYRNQLLRRSPLLDQRTDGLPDEGGGRYVRLNQKQFVPDLWLQLLWEGLRVEVETAFVAGKLEGSCPQLQGDLSGSQRESKEVFGFGTGERSTSGSCKLRQLGVALELEYRLFDERLGLHLAAGVASGDSEAYGLAATNDPSLQRVQGGATADRTISTYAFHPDYRIDLILWRTIMRRVAGAYYARPGVSYDFIRDPYGQLAGGRVDVVYSRATAASQTWGNDPNLGLELDLSLYYRSEDGPDPMDGFYGLVQWGVLFPFEGLGYDIAGTPGKKNAMVLRGVAGIAF